MQTQDELYVEKAIEDLLAETSYEKTFHSRMSDAFDYSDVIEDQEYEVFDLRMVM
jgi:hypothetical protein